MKIAHLAGSAAIALLAANAAQAQQTELTLCWAAWDPANALVELSKDFTTKTGVAMKFEFVPWPNFADRMLNELNSKGRLCDLMIGDSQWIGGAAENGGYVKLNEFFDKEGIKMDAFVPATVTGYSEWPKNTPNYWSLPAFGDVVGWTYRKDWFERPEIQTAFKEKFGRDLTPPATFDELKQVTEFFQGREIDGKTVYGASIFTERGSEGITMGAMDVLYSFGFQYDNPAKPYELEGFVNLLAMICQEAESTEQIPRVQEHYTQIIVSKMLSLMKTNVSRAGLGSQTACFERITDYIERNLKQDICSEELARQASMSLRSLYGLFERYAATTPKNYIRQKKLERVNACLSDPTCTVRNVTELAMDYGFLHLGRFSESYRKQFGELPSDTLKRR